MGREHRPQRFRVLGIDRNVDVLKLWQFENRPVIVEQRIAHGKPGLDPARSLGSELESVRLGRARPNIYKHAPRRCSAKRKRDRDAASRPAVVMDGDEDVPQLRICIGSARTDTHKPEIVARAFNIEYAKVPRRINRFAALRDTNSSRVNDFAVLAVVKLADLVREQECLIEIQGGCAGTGFV